MTPLAVASGVGEWFASTAFQGSLLLAVPVALAAGTVSFFSPCVVPLLPGYVSYVTGLSGADLRAPTGRGRARLLAGTVLFVLGFSVVFVSGGALFGALGDALAQYREPLTRVLGALTVVLGLVFLGAVRFGQRDLRVHRVPAVGVAAAPLLGALFALGWTPCIGPTLAVVLSLAQNEASAARGAVLAFAYSVGLGVPFVLAGLALRRMLATAGWVRRHGAWVTAVGGALLVAVGLLLVTGAWDGLVDELRRWAADTATVV